MFEERNRDYFARREAEERAAANATTVKEAKLIHLQLSSYYAALTKQLDVLEGLVPADFAQPSLT